MKVNPHLPLTPAVLYILLAISGGEKHGYKIAEVVKSYSRNSVKMGNGTLYGSLDRMERDGLVERLPERKEKGRRIVYYKITKLGRETLIKELERYETVVSIAQDKSLISRIKIIG